MKFHKTKDGNKILLSDLELSHLENIINLIERKSIEVVLVHNVPEGKNAKSFG